MEHWFKLYLLIHGKAILKYCLNMDTCIKCPSYFPGFYICSASNIQKFFGNEYNTYNIEVWQKLLKQTLEQIEKEVK